MEPSRPRGFINCTKMRASSWTLTAAALWCAASSTGAFLVQTPHPHPHRPACAVPVMILRATTNGDGNDKPRATKTTTSTNRATDVTITKAVAVPANVKASTKYRSIDEGIYNFNKAVIDTVYDIICFLYPVTGSKRDFARFFVLETVAR